MEELQVKKVYFAKQIKESENYKKFLEIANIKHIKIYEAVAGKRIVIEKKLYFDILWPTNNQIQENVLNNNSIVCKLNYKNFKMLFTGDIEEIAEKEILNYYKNKRRNTKSKHFKSRTPRFENIKYRRIYQNG